MRLSKFAMRNIIIRSVLFTIILVLCSRESNATICKNKPTIKDAYKNADIVFIGKARLNEENDYFEFEVEEVFKGEDTQNLQLNNATFQIFRVYNGVTNNHKYLFYANKRRNT